MVRRKAKQAQQDAPQAGAAITQIQVRDDPTLGYRLMFLLYDLKHLDQSPQSAKRLNTTTNVHYVSEPYFTPAQAAAVKHATVCEVSQKSVSYTLDKSMIGKTVEEALGLHLGGFLNKRQASDDKRPCGPHDILPLYTALFGLDKACLDDESFLRRLKKDRLR